MSQQMSRLKGHALALGVATTPVLRKAEEFCRMLDARGHASLRQLNLVGDAKLFICLECAAAELGQSFDKKLCIERSGMPKKQYQNAMRLIKSMLSLQKNVTIRESAVTLGHAELAEPAAAVLRKYLEVCLGGDTSLISSAMNIAAISVVAKKEGVTLKTSKLTDLAACNKTMLDKIKAHMEKLLQTEAVRKQVASDNSPSVRSSPRKRKSAANDEKNDGRTAAKTKLTSRIENDTRPSDSDSFEVWKRKILAAARSQLHSKS